MVQCRQGVVWDRLGSLMGGFVRISKEGVETGQREERERERESERGRVGNETVERMAR